MPVTADEVIEYNRTFGGEGQFKQYKEQAFRNWIANYDELDVVALCHIARHITVAQYFTGGNHRTALAVFYLKMIDDLNMLTRRKPYQVYGMLDTIWYKVQRGKQEEDGTYGLPAFTRTIRNGGFLIFDSDNPKRLQKDTERARIVTEIKSLADLLERITAPAAQPSGAVTAEVLAELREANAQYRQLKGMRDSFKKYNGGSLVHSSERG